MRTKEFLSAVMKLAWQFVKNNGLKMAEALRLAWANSKLTKSLREGVVKFTFKKVDGTLREAYGTLDNRVPRTNGSRRANDSVQVYFDTEKQEWRCFKKVNLVMA